MRSYHLNNIFRNTYFETEVPNIYNITFRVSSGSSAQSQWRTTTSLTSGDSQSLPKNNRSVQSFKKTQMCHHHEQKIQSISFVCCIIISSVMPYQSIPFTAILDRPHHRREKKAQWGHSTLPSSSWIPPGARNREKHTRITLPEGRVSIWVRHGVQFYQNVLCM